ncbi:MAG: Ldh family oxidoreductase, partial [Pseudoflavonifractor sp.]
QERMAEYRDYIQSIPTLSATPLTFPGEIEAACKAERLEHGIPVPDAVYRELQDLAKRSGVTMNF